MRLPRKLKKGCRTLNGNPRAKWQRKGRIRFTKILNDFAISVRATAVEVELLRKAAERINPVALPSGGIIVPPPPKVGVAQMPTGETVFNREQIARLKHAIERGKTYVCLKSLHSSVSPDQWRLADWFKLKEK